MSDTYELRVTGHLDDRLSHSLGGLAVRRRADGTTALTGPIVDQAALHGLINRVRDLGLPLLSVQRIGVKPPKEQAMQATTKTASVFEDVRLPVQLKLAALWASFMFVYAYVDILGFYQPGVIDDILAGTVWRFDISQSWAVGSLALMIVPILMVVLSLTLPPRTNRMTNIGVASLYVVVSVGNAIGESWVYYYALVVLAEVAILAQVMRYSWKWPRTELRP